MERGKYCFFQSKWHSLIYWFLIFFLKKNSTLQNELLGDFQKEFGKIEVEKPEDLPLKDFAASLGVNFQGAPGKHTSSLISKLISGKMPAGFGLSQVISFV